MRRFFLMTVLGLLALSAFGCSGDAVSAVSAHPTTAVAHESGAAGRLLASDDVVAVGVMGLHADGLETVVYRRIDGDGFIQLPVIAPKIKAAGLTCDALAQSLSKVYQNKEVSVVLPEEPMIFDQSWPRPYRPRKDSLLRCVQQASEDQSAEESCP